MSHKYYYTGKNSPMFNYGQELIIQRESRSGDTSKVSAPGSAETFWVATNNLSPTKPSVSGDSSAVPSKPEKLKGQWVTPADYADSGCTEGKRYYVYDTELSGSLIYVRLKNDLGNLIWYQAENFRLTSGDTENPLDRGKTMSTDWSSYTFHIRSKDQIDDLKITQDLSGDNPLMVLEYGDPKWCRVYIAEEVFHKASHAGPMAMNPKYATDTWLLRKLNDVLDKGAPATTGYTGENFEFDKCLLPKLIKILRIVRRTPWNKPYKAKCVVHKVSI